MINLVRFECGCVGTEPEDGISCLVYRCDRTPSTTCELNDKRTNVTFEPITDEKEVRSYIHQIESLLEDGYKWRQLMELLDIAHARR